MFVVALLASAAVAPSEDTALDHFLRDAKARHDGQHRLVVWDVGSNNGVWADDVMQQLRRTNELNASLLMVDPQPAHGPRLRRLARKWRRAAGIKASHLAAAAWTSQTTLTFFVPSNGTRSDGATTNPAQAAQMPVAMTEIQVAAVDFAAYMNAELSADDAVLVKLDVEGAEYSLLPHLLVSGALCLVDYLHVEWHAIALPEDDLLTGLALRQNLASLLAACPTPPRRLSHEHGRGPGHTQRGGEAIHRQFMRHALGCPLRRDVPGTPSQWLVNQNSV